METGKVFKRILVLVTIGWAWTISSFIKSVVSILFMLLYSILFYFFRVLSEHVWMYYAVSQMVGSSVKLGALSTVLNYVNVKLHPFGCRDYKYLLLG